MKRKNTFIFVISLFALVIIVPFQNCAKNYAITTTSPSSASGEVSGSGSPNPPSPPSALPPPPPPTQMTLKTIQPALAVRALACLMCHADIRANVITDFGYGQSYFMGGNLDWDKDQSWYGDTASSWQTAKQILGTVYVPNVNAGPKAISKLNPQPIAPMNIETFLQTPYVPAYQWDNRYVAQTVVRSVNPPEGAPAVKSVSSIIIKAPSEADLLSIDSQFFSGPVGVKYYNSQSDTGFVIEDDGSGPFVTNSADTIECSNQDVLVKGNLLLKSLSVTAGFGCRIYVLGSVFIEGGFTYTAMQLPNLQITATRAIVMGISESRLNHRLIEDARGLQLSSVDYASLAKMVMNDAHIMSSHLLDAQDNYAVYGTQGTDTKGNPRSSIDYTGLLLNAPLVESRYVGSVSGTIIAEAALFALGEFNFSFDAVFTKVNVLPRLPNPILMAQ